MLKINAVKENDRSSASKDNATSIFSYLFKVSGSCRDNKASKRAGRMQTDFFSLRIENWFKNLVRVK